MNRPRALYAEKLEDRHLLAIAATVELPPVFDMSTDTATTAAAASVVTPSTTTGLPTTTFNFADNGQLLANPGTGWEDFDSPQNTSGFPSDIVYVRFDWSQIEPVLGQYNFAPIDQALASIKSPQRLALRIMTFNDDAGPTAYATAGLAGTWATYNGIQRFQPNLNDPAVQAAVGNLINALGHRYSDPTRIDSVDIGFFGPWGEWSETNVFNVPLPTEATCDWLINTMKNAFPDIPILANAFMDQEGGLDDAFAAGLGWRGDGWGDEPRTGETWTNEGNLYDPIIAANSNQWQTSPIYMESADVVSQWPADGISLASVAQWTIANHVSVIEDKFDPNLTSAEQAQLGALLLKIGYRPLISQLSITGDTLNITIQNNGNAPCYDDRYLQLNIGGKVVNTGIDLKGLLPGASQFTVTNTALAGASTLKLGFVNQAGVADIQLAEAGTQNNYLVVPLKPAAISISGPTGALNNQTQSFIIDATDLASSSTSSNFQYTINWGDGSAPQVVTAPSGTIVSHAFSTFGALTISVTANDASGLVTQSTTSNITINGVQLQPNSQNPKLTDLVWSGSPGNDSVRFTQTGSNSITVTTLEENGTATNIVQNFTGVTGHVIASGNAGDDTLDASKLTTISATLNGGPGNNILYGGQAGDTLIGGSNGAEGTQGSNIILAGNGANTIYGNAATGVPGETGGDNVIVGGSGADTIYGNFGSTANNGGEGGQNLIVGGGGADTIYASQGINSGDGGEGSILIAGTTTLNQTALIAILNEWTSTASLSTKIGSIVGNATGGLNGTNYLKIGSTILNDASIDQLFSDSNGLANWLIYAVGQDTANRVKSTDVTTNL